MTARAAGLRRARLHTNQSLARVGAWSAWFDSAFLLQLDAAQRYFHGAGLGPRRLAFLIGANGRGLQRTQWQRTCVRLTSPDRAPPLRQFLERRLARWHCGLTAPDMAARALATYPEVARVVPPRVLAACLRSLWNGWCTARRFQGHAGCCFGCPDGEDSVEHYANCREVAIVASALLDLPRAASQESRLAHFLLLDPMHDAATASELRRRALVTGSVYLTHCWHRHSHLAGAEACRNALRHTIRELLA